MTKNLGCGEVVAGIDTHADTHHVAVIDITGQELGDDQFPATARGYADLADFVTNFGNITRVGVEGTGSYGAGITRHLQALRVEVVEIIRPHRQLRRMHGKTDQLDAYAAARTALASGDHPIPKTGQGPVEAIRYLFTARRSAIKARSAAIVQLKSLLVTAPDGLREKFAGLTPVALIAKIIQARSTQDMVAKVALQTLKSLARRYRFLCHEVKELEKQLAALVTDTAPGLTAAFGVGVFSAAQLLITAGDNPHRLRSEASFAALCGVSPIPASSGKTNRHRLNRGGDRQANSALHAIALSRWKNDERTQAYITKKRAEGRGTKEILRCLKRAIAREIYKILTQPQATKPAMPDLKTQRETKNFTVSQAAQALKTWPARISDIEHNRRPLPHLTHRYQQWLQTA